MHMRHLHCFILQTNALLVTFNGFTVFEIRKNLNLRKILPTPKILIFGNHSADSNLQKKIISQLRACYNRCRHSCWHRTGQRNVQTRSWTCYNGLWWCRGWTRCRCRNSRRNQWRHHCRTLWHGLVSFTISVSDYLKEVLNKIVKVRLGKMLL